MRVIRLSANKRRNLVLAVLFAGGILCLRRFWVYGSEYSLDNPVYALRINEVCTDNPGIDTDSSVIYEDYIELYNPTPYPVSLENLYLSDDRSRPHLAALPPDTIEPESYYVVYAVESEDSAPEGCPFVLFRLAAEETVFLNSSFSAIDSVTVPAVDAGAVYARTGENPDTYSQVRPSPGLSNDRGSLILEKPEFSAESGFYEEDFFLEITAPENTSVYYTLDGSEPGTGSFLYTDPLLLSDITSRENLYSAREDIAAVSSNYRPPDKPVDKSVVVRAAAYDDEGNYSNTATATYFLEFGGRDGYENMAILSLVVDPEDFFSSDRGIYIRGSRYDNALEDGFILEGFSWIELMGYMNYYLDGPESERMAHVEYYDSGHRLALAQECGIRIRGKESRSFPQKSFTLFSRTRYGSHGFPPVFFDSDVSCPNVILNCSTRLKKVFFFPLVEDRDVGTQKYVPCQVFLNGEYWGMYYLMENYSAEFLSGYYDIPSENVLLIKNSSEVQEGNPENISRFTALQEYLKQDMSDPKLYENLLAQMDMQSFIDWMCTNIYIANTDTKPFGNNVFTWQTTLPGEGEYQDEKWRWILYDLDDSLGVSIDSVVPSYAIDSFTEHAGYSSCGFLEDGPMPALMKNEDFRRQFVLSFMDMANENFNPARVSLLLDDMEAQYTAAAFKSYERWNTNPLYAPFDQQIEELRTFFDNRYDAIVPCLAKHFSLKGDLVRLTLSANIPQGGTITLNTLTPDLAAGEWTGSYYTDYPVTVAAVPAEGYTFLGWEVRDCQILGSASDPELQVQLRDNAQPVIKAVFGKKA